jgi:hypothetical protein
MVKSPGPVKYYGDYSIRSTTQDNFYWRITTSKRSSFLEAVCEERAGIAAGAGASRQARGVILSTGQLRKQQGDVSGEVASLRRRTYPSVTGKLMAISPGF